MTTPRSWWTWLTDNGYTVVRFDAAAWSTDTAMHLDFVRALHFPDDYGHNLNALRDCLDDVACGDYGWDTSTTGLAVVLGRFDVFAHANKELSHLVTSALVESARTAILFGHRILVLIQSDDPSLEMSPVGATLVTWNDQEWRRSKRG